MKFGCCLNVLSAGYPDGTGIEHIKTFAKLGYDYIELPLAQMMVLKNSEISKLCNNLNSFRIKSLACNNFFPKSIRLTGPNIDIKQILNYAENAITLAARLGAETIVFGSADARNVPNGFPKDEALKQLIFLLRELNVIVSKFGITIVIEPANRFETNIINTISEGLQLTRKVNCRNICLLADYYHMALAIENNSILNKAAPFLKHLHFARPLHRLMPTDIQEDDYLDFANKLKEIKYDFKVSIEGFSSNPQTDAISALHLLRTLFGE